MDIIEFLTVEIWFMSSILNEMNSSQPLSKENISNMKLKFFVVSLDGIDKSGKSTLVSYLAQLSNYTLNILDRGPITNIVWNKIQGRDIEYNLEMWKSTVFVKLNVDKADWEIRCKIHNEPPMPDSYETMTKAYDDMFDWFRNHGFYVLEFNTSKMTQYQIAKKIVKYVDEINAA